MSEAVLSWVHAKRRAAVKKMVCSAVSGGQLTVTGLGRSMKSAAREKHCIKCSDRLLSNPHLQAERKDIYRAVAAQVLRGMSRPVILIDWSDVNERHGLYLLRASIAVESRALTLYEEIHVLSAKEKPETHHEFLRVLKQILPQEVRPIIVTDAGFRTPWFRDVSSFGWDWVGRVRNRTMVQLEQEFAWRPCKSLYERARSRPTVVGRALMNRSNPIPCALVLYKAKPKGRFKRTVTNVRARSSSSKGHSTCAREPWLLATSLSPSSVLAKRVVKLYSTRMQIEEAFRDLKSARCGLSLEYSNTRTPQRLAILVMIGTLANMFLWLLGKALELSKQHRQYQANSLTARKVLSPMFLGRRIARHRRVAIEYEQIKNALRHLRKIAASIAYGY